MKSENVIICLVGKSPQIVTEALFFLEYKRKTKIDRIVIVTTNDCYSEVKRAIPKAIKNLAEDYKIELNSQIEFREAIDEFYDYGEESSLTNLIYEVIKTEKLKGNALHCIISGGRKTMSVDLAMALSIFGNDNDKMYQVVASEQFAKSQKFYPTNDEEAKELYFYEKPFVKLKISNLGKADTYPDFMRLAQAEIDSRLELPILEVNPLNKQIVINGKAIRFQPLPFAVYMFFAKNAGKFIRGGKAFSDKHLSEIWEIYTKYAPSHGHMQRVSASSMQQGKVNFELVQKAISVIRNQIMQTLNNDILSDFYVINSIGSYADKKYGIKIPKNRVKIIKEKNDIIIEFRNK